ncbi:MAG: hypothetical protein ABR975_10055 [Vulcanimicrobiaceae bacterium]
MQTLRVLLASIVTLVLIVLDWNFLAGEKVVERLTLGATIILALATYALFAATTEVATQTSGLSLETAKLAKDAVKGNELAERHHRETLRPIVWQDVRLDCVRDGREAGPWIFRITGECANLGNGPAKGAYAYVDIQGFVRCIMDIGPLAAGERRNVTREFSFDYSTAEAEETFDRWPLIEDEDPVSSLRNWPCTVRTIYWSIFSDEDPWHTVQRLVTGTRNAMQNDTHEPVTGEWFSRNYAARFYRTKTREFGAVRGEPKRDGSGEDALNFE